MLVVAGGGAVGVAVVLGVLEVVFTFGTVGAAVVACAGVPDVVIAGEFVCRVVFAASCSCRIPASDTKEATCACELGISISR